MLQLLPEATSRASSWLGILGLDMWSYRWSVVSGTEEQWRGALVVEYYARRATLDLDSAGYRMELQKRRLLQTEFMLLTARGDPLASAARQVRGVLTRETVVRMGPDEFVMSGGGGDFAVHTVGGSRLGSMQVERRGWSVRQSYGFLHFDNAVSAVLQVFLFWLSIHRDLDARAGD